MLLNFEDWSLHFKKLAMQELVSPIMLRNYTRYSKYSGKKRKTRKGPPPWPVGMSIEIIRICEFAKNNKPNREQLRLFIRSNGDLEKYIKVTYPNFILEAKEDSPKLKESSWLEIHLPIAENPNSYKWLENLKESRHRDLLFYKNEYLKEQSLPTISKETSKISVLKWLEQNPLDSLANIPLRDFYLYSFILEKMPS